MSTPGSFGPLLIGWKEIVTFPEWGNCRVKAKIDTGARTSALDTVSYELWHDGRSLRARLHLMLDRRRRGAVTVVDVPILELVKVKCSSGQVEERPVLETLIQLGPVRKRIRITVTNRASMCFRMILGRKALADDFLVDVGHKYVLRR